MPSGQTSFASLALADGSPIRRSRLWLGAGCLLVIALGLASRRYPWLFPEFFGKYPGDALWALMVFLGCAWCWPRASTSRIASLAFAVSCLVEFSQLYRAPWLNALRATTPGHLVLGSTFAWPDIAAYAVGVLAGALVDAARFRVDCGAGRGTRKS